MSAKKSKSLTVFCKIDEGSFGQIFLVRKNGGLDDGQIYAMKSIRTLLTSEEQHRICRNELKMLKLVQGAPFIIQLKYACKTLHHYNMIMDYMAAGNLFDLLQFGRLTLAETTICCAEIVLAIEYLHQHRIVYRDLKLENILISGDNHILITDFGLARRITENGRLTDEAGTVAYFAPEMLNSNKGHSFEVDWWSLGIIAFELLVGHTPFLSSAMERINDRLHRSRILREEPHFYRLNNVDQNVEKVSDLIRKLLIKDPDQRLGAGQTGYTAVKQHPFFSKLNWRAVRLKVYKCLQRKVPTSDIDIDADKQEVITLEEPFEQRRKQFYYVAPELREDCEFESFLGFSEEDLNTLPQKIPLPSPIYDLQVTSDLFIRTTTPVEVLKQMIVPKKTVHFADVIHFAEEDDASPIRTRQRPSDQRHSPYPAKDTPVETGPVPRRSERVASKRTTRCSSIS